MTAIGIGKTPDNPLRDLPDPFVRRRCPKCGVWLIAVRDHDERGEPTLEIECRECGWAGAVPEY